MKRGFPFSSSPSPLQKERGGALLQALFAVGMISAVAGTALQHLQTQDQLRHIQLAKEMRVELGSQLAVQLSNPEMILYSSQFPADATSPGNALLSPCTALDTTDMTPCSQGSFPAEGIEFLLIPPLSYKYPIDKGSLTNANCPDPTTRSDISCFLAGKKAGVSVGYNLQGYISALGPSYPLEAKAYFRPYCPTVDNLGNPIPPPPAGETCASPKGLDVRYELVHHLYNGTEDTGTIGYLGIYPPTPQWHTLSSTFLHGQTCNPGANIQSIDAAGLITCVCSLPYQPTGVLNALGPLCQPETQTCPAGSLLKGRHADFSPICETEAQNNYQEWTITLTETSTATSPPATADCNVLSFNTVGGWVKKMNQRCDTSYTIVQHSMSTFVWSLLMGLGGGVVAAALFIALLNPSVGISVIVLFGAMALGGYIAWKLSGSPTTTVLVEGADPNDPNNASDFVPSVRCQIEVICRAYN